MILKNLKTKQIRASIGCAHKKVHTMFKTTGNRIRNASNHLKPVAPEAENSPNNQPKMKEN